MSKKKKSLYNVIYVLLLLIAIIILFQWYMTQNRKRMEERNKNYALDSDWLKAVQIDDEFNNAQDLINTYIYFLEKSLTEPGVSVQMLKEMEKNTLFDALRFTDLEGVNYASDGRISDATNRDYYQKGIQGESGTSVIFNSLITGEAMVGFYAPVRYEGEIIGVLRGVFLAEGDLQDMLTTTYFGEEADVFLCTPAGRIIAGSDDETYQGDLPGVFAENGVIDKNTAADVRSVFQNGGKGAFVCGENSKVDNICVLYLPENDFVLVQTFPKSVTQSMIRAENMIGIQLETMMIALFAIYILMLILRARWENRRLERENREMGYITAGVTTLFSRFIMIDFERERYQYLAGTKPGHPGFETNGKYSDLIRCLSFYLVEENERREFVAQLQKESIIAALAEQNDIRIECHVSRDDGVEWEHFNIICLERKGGAAVKALLIRQNITEIKEKELHIQEEISLANQVLTDALTQAQRANRVKATFLSNMSHDIRTPMNAIIGFATLAEDHLDDERQLKDCLQKVLSSSRQLLELIDNIFYVSEMEEGSMKVEEQNCILSELLNDLEESIRQQAERKCLELRIETSGVINDAVITDQQKLEQILLNLLSNAVKYTPDGGSILFRAEQKTTFRQGYGDYVFIVQDNGIGMSQEFVTRIYEPFEREVSATKSGILGTGLGLTITKYIIDLMDGNIYIQSAPGQGSTFTVELTLKLQALEETEKIPAPEVEKNEEGLQALETERSAEDLAADFSGKYILLVEDIALNRKIAEVMLTKAGCTVETAPDGTDAVAMVEKSSEYYYDAVLMDLQMPVMDGYEATKAIRNLPREDVKTMPIIAVTANALEEDREAALRCGMNAYITKPLNRALFMEVLGQYIK